MIYEHQSIFSSFITGIVVSAILHLVLANGYPPLRNKALTDRFCG